MTFSLTPLQRDPADRVFIHVYNEDGEADKTMETGNRIQVRLKVGDDIIELMDETVPEGKLWDNVHFQFQAEELSI